MTRAHRDAHWSDAPSLSPLWLAALLRLVAMLVSNVAAHVRMIASVLSGECHTDVDPAGLPEPKRDTAKEPKPAATSSHSTKALMVSSAANAARRVYPELVEGSNHEGEFTDSVDDDDSGELRSDDDDDDFEKLRSPDRTFQCPPVRFVVPFRPRPPS